MLEVRNTSAGAGLPQALQKRPVCHQTSATGSPDQERTFVAFINWRPRVRLRGMSSVRIYDGDNRMIGQSTPAKADLRQDQVTVSWWMMPVPSTVGVYRVDALLDGTPMWRGYVRINP
jgi:hypothetical protein